MCLEEPIGKSRSESISVYRNPFRRLLPEVVFSLFDLIVSPFFFFSPWSIMHLVSFESGVFGIKGTFLFYYVGFLFYDTFSVLFFFLLYSLYIPYFLSHPVNLLFQFLEKVLCHPSLL